MDTPAKVCGIALCIALVAAAGPCVASTDFAAIDVARRYSQAVSANDCDMAVSLTSPAVRARDKKPNQTRDVVCGSFRKLHENPMTETIDEPRASLTDGDRRLLLVPVHREFGPVFNRKLVEYDYVVHSIDGGQTWHIIDLGCINERWIREVFPSYLGEPQVRDAQLRHLTPAAWPPVLPTWIASSPRRSP